MKTINNNENSMVSGGNALDEKIGSLAMINRLEYNDCSADIGLCCAIEKTQERMSCWSKLFADMAINADDAPIAMYGSRRLLYKSASESFAELAKNALPNK